LDGLVVLVPGEAGYLSLIFAEDSLFGTTIRGMVLLFS